MILSCCWVLWLLSASGCKKAEPCPLRFDDVASDKRADGIECSCTGPISGTIWGNEIYSSDSAICSAAIHAGAIPATGGTVTARQAPGCPKYKGVTAHGITSQRWSSHSESFYFVGHGKGACPAVPTDLCPTTYSEIPAGKASADFTCSCEGDENGALYGTDIYTTDSSICRAAVHAGVITSAGGSVTVRSAAGCSKYEGKAQNGMTSSSWSSYPNSFFFPSKGTGKCL